MSFDFTQLLFFVLWSFVVLGFILWFVNLYLKRKLVTVLSTTVLMKIFIPLILMYPFAFSKKNIMSTGTTGYRMYINEVNNVFIISLIGIAFFAIGSYVATKIKTKHPIMNNFSKAYYSLLNTKTLFMFLICLVAIFLYMFKIGFSDSFFFGGRSFAMENTTVRPISNFFYTAGTVFLMLTLTKYYQQKTKILLFFVLIALFMALTQGTRGAVLNSILMFVFMYYNINGKTRKGNFLKFSFTGILLLVIAMYLGEVRQGVYNFITAMVNSSDKIIYGNNFSDLRDFAWVKSYWDENFLYGKTIISGLLAFIPSSILTLRSKWGLGIFTVTTIGYDTSVHPGLRPGIFGEAFFNFGILGVCVAGFMYGFVINMISRYVQEIINTSTSKKEIIYKTSLGYLISGLIFNFMITAGFFTVYVNLLILFIGFVLYAFRKKYNYNRIKKPRKRYRITW